MWYFTELFVQNVSISFLIQATFFDNDHENYWHPRHVENISKPYGLLPPSRGLLGHL